MNLNVLIVVIIIIGYITYDYNNNYLASIEEFTYNYVNNNCKFSLNGYWVTCECIPSYQGIVIRIPFKAMCLFFFFKDKSCCLG